MPTQRLINKTISRTHHRLLKAALSAVSASTADVTPLDRYGFSGATLYRLTPPDSIAYVVKIHGADKITREHNAASSVQPQFTELVIYPLLGPIDGQMALIYRQTGGNNVVELKHKYEKALMGDLSALREVLTAIDGIYSKLSTAHTLIRPVSPATFRDQYGNYVQIKTGSINRLAALFASHHDPLHAYGKSFLNPQKDVENILDMPLRPITVNATHGDLHPSNVVFSRSGDPWLVDFAHAGRHQHLFKDFVTMESSFRFMMFPPYVHPSLIGPIDDALNTNWDATAARKIIDSASESPCTDALHAMVACVTHVRRACDTALAVGFRIGLDDKKEEYFRSLALLLLGQQQFSTFPLLRVAANLHSLASLYA